MFVVAVMREFAFFTKFVNGFLAGYRGARYGWVYEGMYMQ